MCGFDYRLKMGRNKDLSSETRQFILVLRNEGYSMREVGGPGAQLRKRTNTLECLV